MFKVHGSARAFLPPFLSSLLPVAGHRVSFPFPTRAHRSAHSHFSHLWRAENPDFLKRIEPIISGASPLINPGVRNGEVSPEFGTGPLRSPPGHDRAFFVGEGLNSVCVKGSGERDRTFSVLALQGIISHASGRQGYKPIDMNSTPDRDEQDRHTLLGGADIFGLRDEAQVALDLLQRAHALNQSREGIILPLTLQQISAFAIRSPQGQWDFPPGWDFFTSLKYMDEAQVLGVTRFVQSHSTNSIRRLAARRLEKRLKSGEYQRVSRLLRWLVGRTFMKLYQPASYTYAADEFRIGHLYECLVANEFGGLRNLLVEAGCIPWELVIDTGKRTVKMKKQPRELFPLGQSVDENVGMEAVNNATIKQIIDRQLERLFAMFGLSLSFPESTHFDLHSSEERVGYLRQVYVSNQTPTQKLAQKIAAEIGRQLGILHGSGGHAGGHVYVHRLGAITIEVENNEGRKFRIELTANGTHQIYDETDDQIDEKTDLSSFKVVKMTASKHGNILLGGTGGGSTRPDNLGYGLRDLRMASFEPLKGELGKVVRSYPKKINGLNLEDIMRHFHIKLIQQADLDILSAINLYFDQEYLAGSFVQLVEVLGGDRALFDSLQSVFSKSYEKFYRLSCSKFAPPFYRRIEESVSRPSYRFLGSSLEPKAQAFIGNLFPSSVPERIAA